MNNRELAEIRMKVRSEKIEVRKGVGRFFFILHSSVFILLALGGCTLLVHPFRDELANEPPVTTASVETVQNSKATRSVQQRDWPAKELYSQNGAVRHHPLYFEDGFEDKGSDDGKFAWTHEDYVQLFSWRGRFLINTIAFPVSVVVTPPWTVMESDGVLSRQALGWEHDAERAKCVEPCPTASAEPCIVSHSEPPPNPEPN